MAWAIKTHDLTSIYSFDAAEAHWNSKEAWKNEHASWRPLASKRKPHLHLVKLSGDQGYECVLYQTPLVTYWKDGRVTLSTYNSASSIAFARHMTPIGCTPLSHKGNMFWRIRTPEGYRYHRDQIQIEPASDGMWRILTGKLSPEQEWVLDRKKAAQVRKLLKPFCEWHTMTTRLAGTAGHRGTRNTFIYDVSVMELLNDHANYERFPEFAKLLRPSVLLRNVAYTASGARVLQPVPFDRLSRRAG